MSQALGIFTTLFFASVLLVPGFILYRTIALFVVHRNEDIQIFALRFLAYSLFLYLLFLPHFYWIYSRKFYIRHPFYTADYAIFLIFVLPVVVGVITGISLQWYKRLRHHLADLAERCYIYFLDHETSAWGYQFCRLLEGIDDIGAVMVYVTMKDATKFIGAYGKKSFASEYSENADLFLERLYNDDGEGLLEPVANSYGVLIKQADIYSIEFRTIYHPPKQETQCQTKQVTIIPVAPKNQPENLTNLDH